MSYEYLFKVFCTILTNDDKKENISIKDLIAFWYKGVLSYVKPYNGKQRGIPAVKPLVTKLILN